MSGESPKKIGRGYERNLDAGQFQPMIDSWDLHLRAEKKSAKTIRTYLEAAQWFAAEYLIQAGFTDWDGVRARQVQEWTVTLLGRYSDSYANNQFRALQQFFKWHATEDPDEQRPNPMAGLKPPKIGDKLVPVFTDALGQQAWHESGLGAPADIEALNQKITHHGHPAQPGHRNLENGRAHQYRRRLPAPRPGRHPDPGNPRTRPGMNKTDMTRPRRGPGGCCTPLPPFTA